MHEFFNLKKKILENEYQHLNAPQKEAVFTSGCPMLILAGAGSGKTTTVVHKIAYIIRYGNAYYSNEMPSHLTPQDIARMEQEALSGIAPGEQTLSLIRTQTVMPYRILAFTFTNKAAKEMRERIGRMLGDTANDIWMGTFHSMCVRILRRDIERLDGYNRNFVIYDTDDQKVVIKSCLNQLGISDREFTPKDIAQIIGRAKDVLMSPEEFLKSYHGDYKMSIAGQIYKLYQKKLKENNALDFDDIIILTIELFEKNQEIWEHYSKRFEYVFVDEYQDTNAAQYRLISLLSDYHKNLCVVGDDDQSIYGWRGADIRNIIEFEKQYPNCKVIKLEQNYRSTSTILDAANQVISRNKNRKSKKLWTQNEIGEKITLYPAIDERDEAYYIANAVSEFCKKQGKKYSDFAVLYRTNAQSRIVEDSFIREGIPYKIVGGLRFYERKEIKDLMAYLRLVQNSSDNVSFKRIINLPRRGIGETSVAKIEALSNEQEIGMYEVLKSAQRLGSDRSASAQEGFIQLIEQLREQKDAMSASAFIGAVIEASALMQEYKKEGEVEAQARYENMQELVSVAKEMEKREPSTLLEDFLAYTSLLADVDTVEDIDESVTLMTMHSAKGLEYPVVFVIGMEEGLFPRVGDFYQDDSEIEEERRLCYVAITRAKEKLFLIHASSRMIYGKTNLARPSRFLKEIPQEVLTGLVQKSIASVLVQKPEASYNFRKAAKTAPSAIASLESFIKGDAVSHKKFGKGFVVEITTAGGIVVLAVDFKEHGRKNLIASSVTKD